MDKNAKSKEEKALVPAFESVPFVFTNDGMYYKDEFYTHKTIVDDFVDEGPGAWPAGGSIPPKSWYRHNNGDWYYTESGKGLWLHNNGDSATVIKPLNDGGFSYYTIIARA